MNWRIQTGDCRESLRTLEDESVQCVVTSPPYFGLRDYGDDEQIGLEATPEDYVAELVEVFREVRRVLRDDGTVWLNLGDSYNANPKGSLKGQDKSGLTSTQTQENAPVNVKKLIPGLKPKDLIGIPWRVAFALQADGWYLRSEIIWAKPNPMPESVTDRPTKAHEQIFLLTKSPTYFYDAHAVREPNVCLDPESPSYRPSLEGDGGDRQTFDGKHDGRSFRQVPAGGRNRRSVWEIATVPYKEAHFATFPPKLVEPCVRAGTPDAGSCSECGAPRRRVVRKSRTVDGEQTEGAWEKDDAQRIGANGVGHWRYETSSETLGWRPTCVCGAPPGIDPDDLELIESPTGAGGTEDPSLDIGRAGYSRPRGAGAGRRTMTRYQQRAYADQLKRLPKTAVAALIESGATTADAWAHYTRTDRGGARPLPPELLAHLLDDFLDRVEPPEWELPETAPAMVLDPFAGAGTTGLVALRLERSFVGLELNEDYAEQARQRLRDDAPLLNTPAEVPETPGALA